MIVIDEMKVTDWEAVSKIFAEGIASNLSSLEKEVPTYEDWDLYHRKDGRFVARKDDKVVGFINLVNYSHRSVYSGVAEVSVYVDSSVRGEGIGTMLLNFMIEYADSHRIWTLQSNIIEENEGSIQLHEKCEFRRVGYRDKIGMDQYGRWRNIILMERRSKTIGFEGCDMSCCKMK